MTSTVAWIEIPTRDFETSVPFYKTVFKYDIYMMEMGPVTSAVFRAADGAVSADLTIGTPASKGQGSVIHLTVPDKLEDAVTRCSQAGGELVGPIVDIPPGRFQLAYDLDGNTIGLFEPNVI